MNLKYIQNQRNKDTGIDILIRTYSYTFVYIICVYIYIYILHFSDSFKFTLLDTYPPPSSHGYFFTRGAAPKADAPMMAKRAIKAPRFWEPEISTSSHLSQVGRYVKNWCEMM